MARFQFLAGLSIKRLIRKSSFETWVEVGIGIRSFAKIGFRSTLLLADLRSEIFFKRSREFLKIVSLATSGGLIGKIEDY